MLEAETVVSSGTMKVTCSREELTQKLAVVSRGVSTRTAVQILGGILLTAEPARLTLGATDMELSLRASLEARVDGEGAVVVPGRLLVELARLLPEAEVSIEQRADEGVIRISSGSFESRLNTYTAEDFPRLPDAEGLDRHAVDRDALLGTIGRVGRSASRDESRPVLTGILVRFETGKLVMAATDSYRLSVMAQRNSPLRLRFADGALTVSARTQDVGEAEESLPVAFTSEPLAIGFNAEFLRDGIESVTGETIRFRLISPLRPCVLQAEGSDDFLYLIMPIRLAG